LAPPIKHPWITDEERDYILSGQKNQDIDQDGEYDEGYVPSYGEMLSRKESWGVIITYLVEVYNIDVKGLAAIGWVPYVGAMFGAWFGGLLAQNRLKAGWDVNKTRKAVIVLGCLIMLGAFYLLLDPGSANNAVIIMAVILFGFQTSIGNIQTLPSDLLGKGSVGSLAGFAGMSAKFTAAGLTLAVPVLTAGANYHNVFILGAVLAFIVIASILFLCPKIEPLKPKS